MLLKWVEIAWWFVFSVFCLTSLPLHPLELDIKVKVSPLQASAGPWGSGRLGLPAFLHFRHFEGG